jgi:pimeloyl-ACP methyl ester carboxylesterase
MIEHAESADGTRIGYEVTGSGPAALVVHGSGADRTQWDAIKPALAERFTLYLMDRRGRGLSETEAGPYAVEREGEDVAAVAAAAGDRPLVFGHGFGGLPALLAAAGGTDFAAMLIDETPSGRPGGEALPNEIADGLAAALDESQDSALAYFLKNVVGLPDEAIEGARKTEMWEIRKATMPSLLRELRGANAHQRDDGALAELRMPVRVVVGTESTDKMRQSAETLHAVIPHSELVVVDGRLFTTMYSDAEAAAREVSEFLLENAGAT